MAVVKLCGIKSEEDAALMNEKRIQILQKYGYNFYQAAENDNLYGHELC